jgi:hypothetical protein
MVPPHRQLKMGPRLRGDPAQPTEKAIAGMKDGR